MTTPPIRTLAHIGMKLDTSRRDHLTITRCVVRALCEQRQSIHAERHALRREAGKLREHLPFTRPAIGRRGGAEPRSGSPLHQACQLALLEFIRTCPEHLLPDPFAASCC